ncbi:unnamed protein product [Caenorhabditis angaria]|uniref:Uncharacterized protein n=1 Tax=Caenorhabditis angaria TaxID=860376 RepID=A0A9P1IQ93_9PELO|nr:unnamed protein product [Caenorhabditis angaria]
MDLLKSVFDIIAGDNGEAEQERNDARLRNLREENKRELKESREKTRSNNDYYTRQREAEIKETQNSYENNMNTMMSEHSKNRQNIEETTKKELEQINVDFGNEMLSLGKTHSTETENIKKSAEKQRTKFEEFMGNIENEKKQNDKKRLFQLDLFGKEEIERSKANEEKMRERAANLHESKMEQLKLKGQKQEHLNAIKTQHLQSNLDLMMIKTQMESSQKLAIVFQKNLASSILKGNESLKKAMNYICDLKNTSSNVKFEVCLKEWALATNVNVGKIRSLRADLNNYTSADQDLRETINSVIGSIETEYQSVQTLQCVANMAIDKNDIKQIEGLKTKFESHFKAIQNHEQQIRKVMAPHDKTLENLTKSYQQLTEKLKNQARIESSSSAAVQKK